MPLPPDFPRPKPFDDVTLYGKVSYGDLLQFLVLDVRQYHPLQPCDRLTDCPERYDAGNDITGPEQEEWLNWLSAESPRWNVIANTIFHCWGTTTTPATTAGRLGRLRTLPQAVVRAPPTAEAGCPNPVVISGDIHAAWVIQT